MKRKASRSAHYERPAKMAKTKTESTVSRTLSTLRREVTKLRASLPPPKWPSLHPPPLHNSETAADESDPDPAAELPAAPLRRAPTLPVEEPKAPDTQPSNHLQSSTRRSESVVATLVKRGSTSTLDDAGNITTVKRLPSGTSVGEITSLEAAPAEIRRELSKAAGVEESGMMSGDESAAPLHSSGTDGVEKDEVALEEKEKERDEEEEEPLPPPPVLLPPGGLIEIAFSFDTTGSMSQCLEEVRGRVGDMIQRLQADIPGIRIAVIAHGDYCDKDNYIVKWIDFGSSLPEMCDFVRTISRTSGGDFEECYELVLARVQTELSWTPGSQRSLVMIGDATPHPFSYYRDQEEKLDWEEEVKKLANMGVKIYAVQALKRTQSTKFYSSMARITKGRHLKLDQFNNVFDIIMAVCYRERGVEFVEAYEDEVREREGHVGLHKDLEGLFGALKDDGPSSSKRSKTSTVAATPVLLKGAAKRKASAKKSAVKVKGKGATKRGRDAEVKGKAKATALKAMGSSSPKKTKAKGKKVAGKRLNAKALSKKAKDTKAKVTKVKATKAKKEKLLKGKAVAKKAKGKGLKTVKGSKKTKTSKQGEKKSPKTKTKTPKKLKPSASKALRERAQDLDLESGKGAPKVEWSAWKLAMQSRRPTGSSRSTWQPRRNGALGVRNVKLLQRAKEGLTPALYEFGVRLKKKLHVVYFRACATWRRKLLWDTVLLNKPALEKEIDAILAAGGSLSLRRGEVKDIASLRRAEEHLNTTYDYAWTLRRACEGQTHRRLKSNGVLISGNNL